jgi:hypothetical protein
MGRHPLPCAKEPPARATLIHGALRQPQVPRATAIAGFLLAEHLSAILPGRRPKMGRRRGIQHTAFHFGKKELSCSF